MEWTQAHDVFLCREMLVVNPFQYKRKTTQRAKMWETVADHLERIDAPTFKVTVRSVRDRYTLISKKYKKRMQTEKRASGIVPEVSELDVLLEELIELEKLFEEEKNKENEEKTTNKEDRDKAIDIRKKVMETLSETKKRKVNDGEENEAPKKKSRKSSSFTIEYLKEKNDAEFNLSQQELDLKKMQYEDDTKKQEESLKRYEDMMNVMANRNQMTMELLTKTIQK